MAKTALVTGSSRGIGLALCKELHSRGWKVIATCRNPQSLSNEPFYKKLPLSVDSDEQIAALKKELGDEPIHLLINNAGIYTRGHDTLDKLTREHLLHEFNIDSISPMMVTKALIDNLTSVKGSVVNISSLLGSIGDAGIAKSYAYRSSKAALNMMTKVLSLEMKDRLEFVIAFHPGFVATDMVGGPREGAIPAEEAARCMIDSFERLRPEQNGCLLSRLGKTEPW